MSVTLYYAQKWLMAMESGVVYMQAGETNHV